MKHIFLNKKTGLKPQTQASELVQSAGLVKDNIYV